MIDVEQFTRYIVKPALLHIGLDTLAATRLVVGTALTESRLTYLKQVGGGPALGFFQMEPNTHDDIWENYLRFRRDMAKKVDELAALGKGLNSHPLQHSLSCRTSSSSQPRSRPRRGCFP